MSGHTPGEWKATKFNPVTGDIDECYLYIEPGIAVIERKVKGHDMHDVANAHLIAAAPDLLAALEVAADALEMAEFFEKAAQARAALAKARGEQ